MPKPKEIFDGQVMDEIQSGLNLPHEAQIVISARQIAEVIGRGTHRYKATGNGSFNRALNAAFDNLDTFQKNHPEQCPPKAVAVAEDMLLRAWVRKEDFQNWRKNRQPIEE